MPKRSKAAFKKKHGFVTILLPFCYHFNTLVPFDVTHLNIRRDAKVFKEFGF